MQGGNEKMKQLVPGLQVYGGSFDNVKGCTHQLDNGDKLQLGSHVNILALHTPWYAFIPLPLQVLPFLHHHLGMHLFT